jgi:hypothetical protein
MNSPTLFIKKGTEKESKKRKEKKGKEKHLCPNIMNSTTLFINMSTRNNFSSISNLVHCYVKTLHSAWRTHFSLTGLDYGLEQSICCMADGFRASWDSHPKLKRF